jgi:hypothetical protein
VVPRAWFCRDCYITGWFLEGYRDGLGKYKALYLRYLIESYTRDSEIFQPNVTVIVAAYVLGSAFCSGFAGIRPVFVVTKRISYHLQPLAALARGILR